VLSYEKVKQRKAVSSNKNGYMYCSWKTRF